MATATVVDYRRTDLRTNVLENPFWITSSVVDGAVNALDDKATIVFSFPTASQQILVENVVIEIISEFTAGTTVDVGAYTLATDAVTTGGVATLVDADEYLEAADITATTAGFYGAANATGNDWLTAKVAGGYAAPYLIVGAASTVPAIVLTFANAGTIIAGQARLHMLITIVPGT